MRPSAPTNWVATALPLSAAAGLEEKLASGAGEDHRGWRGYGQERKSRRRRGWSSHPIPARRAP